MAHLWIQDKNQNWAATLLSGFELSLESFTADGKDCSSTPDGVQADVLLLRSINDKQKEWSILAAAGNRITINGIPLLLGIRVLKDRDEIRWSRDRSAFYSSEEPAAIVNFPQEGRKIFCPRCKQEIAPETPAVRCPGCGIWHHQSDQLPCYSYAESCATCAHKTSLDGGYDWKPEEM